MKKIAGQLIIALSVVILVAISLLCIRQGGRLKAIVMTPDQLGYALMEQGAYDTAAETFKDPYWQAVARFRAGEFEEALRQWSGLSTPAAAYNEANAFVMLGKYEDAVKRYDKALALRPDWEAAKINRAIAVARAERLQHDGADMTGGKIGADEIVIDSGKSAADPDGDDAVIESSQLSDEELRAVWLRQVDTKPGDFLRAKFNYQQAVRKREE